MAVEPDVEEAISQLVATRDSPGYLVLLQRIDLDRQNALESLATVDPFDSNEILRLQSVVTRFDYFAETIDELILSGAQEETLAESEPEYEE